ncbi:mannosyl phosphorylinositol ceramide synthase SUR1 [Penicillium cf. griseofulvum]|uniref:Mannosyl phosphorylinositol ceramide synthase SUR1 n=1 Tax=Penicillium cf. griseofulvum TaxID=2972120 RepID=A0A9W9MS81_9EURO|nr:mannosyl phosphorylinositol ceramide synthase SUR1 [Penicillium cf. griseofulvum]KAJ5440429.1 mannosyl phosphorylinositol ceramide synthase SUR1 [Penicillium cf. griseofulvum]
MRHKAAFFGLMIVGGIWLLLPSFLTPVTLLFEDASADLIPASELTVDNVSSRPLMIPKILHQTYKNETIPDSWKDAQQSCINLHPDYEYILWTDRTADDFIATHYPWFLDTFEHYPYPIQRADTIRYFILSHLGGIYIDMDDGCNRRLDPLLTFPAWVRRTTPTGISNDAMGSIPQHPFFLKVIESLQSYNRSWLFPYITIMSSTGPLFLSIIWKQYMRRSRPLDEASRVRVLIPEGYMHHPRSFFTHHVGNSWHRDDAKIIFWMGAHWQIVTVCGFLVMCLMGVCLWMLYCRLVLVVSGRRYQSTLLSTVVLSSCHSRRRSAMVRVVTRWFKSPGYMEDEEYPLYGSSTERDD